MVKRSISEEICVTERRSYKPELILVNIKVTDKKTGRAIDDADVQVRWGEGEEDHSDATTNSKGIAICDDVPRRKVVIRVIANGYAHVAPTVDLKSEEQPIKIELDKRHVEGTTPPPPGGQPVSGTLLAPSKELLEEPFGHVPMAPPG